MANGALLMPQGQFNQQSIVELLRPYLAKPILITQMAANAKRQAILDATASVAAHCEQVTKKRS
jgi:UDP-N-acetylglucosamine--N-acetylmuramyl-(pentapeptide) pyrophosphoryl-undecaprenol N-acetylglucosamine transferase